TPLQAAASRNHVEIVRILLKAGAVASPANGGIYDHPLYPALLSNHGKSVKVFLENGVGANLEGGFYGNALVAACAYGHQAIVRLLLD
ncbi:hypothetical protein M422DRAFT_110944, partial [Sphaerobolus stellatus SS14]